MNSYALAELRSPRAIRSRAAAVLEAGLRGELGHFAVALERLPEVARFTAQITRQRYPDLRVPPHGRMGHFDAEGVARTEAIAARMAHEAPLERARLLTDLITTSVLLDAGAGSRWRYREARTGLTLARSEGLAVASLVWLESGALSSRGAAFEVDGRGLCAVDASALARAFQVSHDNPLVGLDGRVQLLQALGRALLGDPERFGSAGRPGGLIDFLIARAQGAALAATTVLAAVLDGLSSIWPGRLTLGGVPLGDVWQHPAAGGDGLTRGFMPFHKLSQWLTYSLLAPLEVAGLEVRELDALTGLAEYRNGGLFLDLGVLSPKHEALLARPHEVGSQPIVEWRALTVALLDRLAPLVRDELGVDAAALPLASVLEGGTWAAGRAIAQELRDDGGPPLAILSDGTVY